MITIIEKAGNVNNSNQLIMQIGSAAELNDLPTTNSEGTLGQRASVGSIAYTAGLKQIWHLSDTDEWVEF